MSWGHFILKIPSIILAFIGLAGIPDDLQVWWKY